MVFAKLPSLAKQGVVSHASILRRWSQQQIACFSTTAGTTTTTTTNTNASTAANDPSVVLYQYAICPFCNITKAVLSFSSVKYKTIEVNPLTKAELQNFSKDYRKVPIAMVDDVQVNGSDKIVDKVLQHPTVTSYLQQKLQNLSVEQFVHDNDSQEWLTFARDELSSLLYPNICRTWRDSYQAFGYVHNVDTFSTLQKFAIQTVGSLAMYFAASKIKRTFVRLFVHLFVCLYSDCSIYSMCIC